MATEADKTNTGVVATVVVVGTFAMIAISALVAAMVRSEHTELERRRPTNADLETVAELDRVQLAKIEASPAWVDQGRGKVAIPINLAMKLVLDEYAKHPESASPPPPPGLVMNPVPAAGSVGVAAAEPGVPDAPGPVVPAASPAESPAVPPAAAPPAESPAVPPAAVPGATPATGAAPAIVSPPAPTRKAAAPPAPRGASDAPDPAAKSPTATAAPSAPVPAASPAPVTAPAGSPSGQP